MQDFSDCYRIHEAVHYLRGRCILEYWEKAKVDDIVNRLNTTQQKYLFAIKRLGPCSLNTVMNHTGFSCSATSTAIDKLVKLGAVNRERNPENRREIIVSLTPEIDKHLKGIDELFKRRIAEVLSSCTPEETDIIMKGAIILRKKLADYELPPPQEY